ncbi:DUF6916 family protein [Pacificoceanicola onchidii]|uniref:DUF6916 family protein n=1 Tax=Pacificoceanicola onchidii TaxID=2562685 RepID=UPI0010A6835F|nr:hypothetical protein [Pacificoceanicola onchidii]
MIDLATLAPGHFEPLTGKSITVTAGGESVSMTLDNVKSLGAKTKRDSHLEIDGKVIPPREAFVIVIEGPREPVVDQGVYAIDFPELGTLELFMVPFRQDHSCMLYEIGFS